MKCFQRTCIAAMAGVAACASQTIMLGLNRCAWAGPGVVEYDVDSLVGTGSPGYSGDGGPASQATLRDPAGVAIGTDGDLYIADNQNYVIRRVDLLTGIITTVAGNGTPGFSGDGGPAIHARLSSPVGIAVDDDDNIYIADQSNHRIRKVHAATGVITTIAGTGAFGFSGDGGLATKARLNLPNGVAVDSVGNVYIADTSNFRVRKINVRTGNIGTICGTGFPSSTGDGGPPSLANLSSPRRLCFDENDNLYILDRASNARVRRIANGLITRVAGGGSRVADEGVATEMNLGPLTDIAIDRKFNSPPSLVISANYRVFKVDPRGYCRAIAGTGTPGDSGDGGPALEALFNNINGIAVSNHGHEYLSDRSNNRIRYLIETEPCNAPDVTCDGAVNIDDLVQVITNWGPCPPPCPADTNGSGVVDIDDLVQVITNWGGSFSE